MANEVGKAYVSIIASIEGLSNDIKRAVREAVAGIEAEIKGKVNFDKAAVAEDAKKAVDGAQRAVDPVKDTIGFDEIKAADSVRRAIKFAENAAPNAHIKLDIDEAGLIEKVRVTAKVAEKAAPTIKLKTTTDTKGLDTGDIAKFVGNLGSSNPLQSVTQAGEELANTITSAVVPALADAAGTSDKFAISAIELSTSLVAAAAAAGVILIALGALIVVIGTIIGEILAGLAAAVAALIVALPGGIAVALVALTTLSLGFNNVGTAISALVSGNMKSFEKALEKLSPAAAAFVNEFRPLQNLAGAASQVLFAGLSNPQFAKPFEAALNEIKATVLSVAGVFNSFFKDLIAGFSTAQNKIKIKQILDGIAPVLKAILPGVKILGQGLLDAAAAATPGMKRLGGAIGNVAAAVGKFFSRIAESGVLDKLVNSLADLVDAAGPALVDIFETLAESGPNLIATFIALTPVIVALAKDLIEFFNAAAPGLKEFFLELAAVLKDPNTVNGMIQLGLATTEFLIALVPYLPSLTSFIIALTGFLHIVTGIVNFLTGALNTGFGGAIGAIHLVEAAFNTAKSAAQAFVSAMTLTGNATTAIANGMASEFKAALIGISAAMSGISSTVLNSLRALRGGAGRAAGDIARAVADGLSTAISSAYQIGADIIRGLISGIEGMAARAARAAVHVVSDAFQTAKDWLDSHSPSRRWAALGSDTAAGYIVGLTSDLPGVSRAGQDMVAAAMDAVMPISTTATIATRFGGDVEPTNLVQMLVDAQMNRPVILMSDNRQIARVVNDENKKLARR